SCAGTCTWRNWESRHVRVMAEKQLSPCLPDGGNGSDAMCSEWRNCH
ncbi:hypothetical protein L195_g042467, partial [Trifolium pratense]